MYVKTDALLGYKSKSSEEKVIHTHTRAREFIKRKLFNKNSKLSKSKLHLFDNNNQFSLWFSIRFNLQIRVEVYFDLSRSFQSGKWLVVVAVIIAAIIAKS